MIIFSKNLRQLREQAHYTQQQMADKLNIKQQSYARYESGKGEPSLETLVKISGIFEVSCDYLLGQE